MALIQIEHLSFTYPGSYVPVFTDLHFHMDSAWRLGLVGRNGRGKTTLLRLLAGQLQGGGRITAAVGFDLFPFPVTLSQPALHGLRQAIAPFDHWEAQMQSLLEKKTPAALEQWGELEQRYAAQDGYVINELIAAEVGKMQVDPAQLLRPFASFSPGERTRMLLAALFLCKNRFLLIDEPTNHLDMQGRQIAAEYLAGKNGFLLVSHDRAFLDASVDHILALQKTGAVVVRGNYTAWHDNKQRQDELEREQNQRLARDIERLRASSREKASWSDKIEATKIGTGALDRGYVGAQAAKMMKRSLVLQARIEKQAAEKEKLLKDLEYTAPLALQPLTHPTRTLLRLEDVTSGYERQPIINNFSLAVSRGERIALLGPNGCGKSTLLKLLLGQLMPFAGQRHCPQDLVISSVAQSTDGLAGTPLAMAQRLGLSLDHFFMLLRKFDLPREAFEQDAASFSMGQKKKLLLAASMAQSAHLYIWDEPLNYIDVESREQIETMLAQTTATLVFVEHDRRFVERVATRAIDLY